VSVLLLFNNDKTEVKLDVYDNANAVRTPSVSIQKVEDLVDAYMQMDQRWCQAMQFVT
jgi:hypothetical protein